MPRMPKAEDIRRLTPQPVTDTANYDPTIISKSLQGAGDRMFMSGAFVKQESERLAALQAEDAWLTKGQPFLNELTYGDNGYLKIQGSNALNQPLVNNYADQAKAHFESVEASLPNEIAKMHFRRNAAQAMPVFSAGIYKHQYQQSEIVADTNFKGMVSNSENEAALNYKTPARIDSLISRMNATLIGDDEKEGYFQRKGITDDAARSSIVSKTIGGIVSSAIRGAHANGDAPLAAHYLNVGKQYMTLGDYTALQAQVSKENAALTSRNIFKEIQTGLVNGNPTAPTPGNTAEHARFFDVALAQAESSGKQFESDGVTPLMSKVKDASGNLVRGRVDWAKKKSGDPNYVMLGDGAVGYSQILKSTAKEMSEKLGIPFDEKRLGTDKDYNRQLGLTYFNQILERTGRYDFAVADYHAGPGTSQKAVDSATKMGDSSRWKEFLGENTRAHVDRVMSKWTGTADPRQAEEGGAYGTKLTYTQFAELARSKLPANDEHARTVLEGQLHQQYAEYSASRTQTAMNLEEEVQKEIIANGGNPHTVDQQKMLRLQALDPKATVRLNQFAQAVKYPQQFDNSTELTNYNLGRSRYLDMPKAEWDNWLRRNFKQDTQQHLEQERVAWLSGTPSKINATVVKTEVDNVLNVMGVKHGGKEEQNQAVIRVRSAINDFVEFKAREAKGVPVTDDQVRSWVREASQADANMYTDWGLWKSHSPERVVSMGYGDIPSDIRADITRSLIKQGNLQPREDDVVREHARWQLTSRMSVPEDVESKITKAFLDKGINPSRYAIERAYQKYNEAKTMSVANRKLFGTE